MNAQNAHQYVPLVQALADGKTIQFVTGHGTWVDYHPETSYTFGVDPSLYRIKPEPPKPRECWQNIYPGGPGSATWPSREKADANQVGHRIECVHFREVLPETL